MPEDYTAPIRPEPPKMRIGDNHWQDITGAIANGLGYKGGARSRAEAMNRTPEEKALQDEYSRITGELVQENMVAWREYNQALVEYQAAQTRWRTIQTARSPESQAKEAELKADLLLDPDTPNAIRAELAAMPSVMEVIRKRYA